MADFAREQGVADEPVDYSYLATRVWPTADDVREFDSSLSEIRRKGVSRAVDA